MGDDMATYQQLQQLLNNPNARQMLDIIAKAEGVKHGYNTMFGNQRINTSAKALCRLMVSPMSPQQQVAINS